MKMEHVHCAPRAGRVVALHVAVGAQVAARHVVAEVTDVADVHDDGRRVTRHREKFPKVHLT
jgi:pyruvate/2-oxoglutarate dehydrogenase complex dihydrolipoamide acyltransferase (E2) component